MGNFKKKGIWILILLVLVSFVSAYQLQLFKPFLKYLRFMLKKGVFLVLIISGIVLISIGSFTDVLISKNYSFTQFFIASLVELILFIFGVWWGYQLFKFLNIKNEKC